MTTSIRLDARAELLLRRLATQRRQTKSEVIRFAISALAAGTTGHDATSARETAYDRLVHVIGVADSGGAGLSEATGAGFRELLLRRVHGRRSR